MEAEDLAKFLLHLQNKFGSFKVMSFEIVKIEKIENGDDNHIR